MHAQRGSFPGRYLDFSNGLVCLHSSLLLCSHATSLLEACGWQPGARSDGVVFLAWCPQEELVQDASATGPGNGKSREMSPEQLTKKACKGRKWPWIGKSPARTGRERFPSAPTQALLVKMQQGVGWERAERAPFTRPVASDPLYEKLAS